MELATSLLVQLQFTISTWLWLMGCLLLGVALAYLLYSRTSSLNTRLRQLLFCFRALTVATIAFLLFAPLIKKTERNSEKPLIIVAQDNSASLSVSKPPGFDPLKYTSELRETLGALSEKYEVRTFTFSSDIEEGLQLDFKGGITDISSVFDLIQTKFANRNIGAVILASDGIYNRGADPRYIAQNLRSSIYTVALGDTVPKRDLLVANVNYNNIVYLGNQFQIEVNVEAFQSAGSNTVLTVSGKSGVLFSRPIRIGSAGFRTTVPLTLPANSKGVQQLNIRLSPISNELSTQNNTQTIFVEVIDGRQKVLIAANSPHPDLTAIKHSIETNKNYSVSIELASEIGKQDVDGSDLLILHQLPSDQHPSADLLRMAQAKPLFFIVGSQTDLGHFTRAQNLLGITSGGNYQEVSASVQSDFYGFALDEANRLRIGDFAPLISPFGNYALKSPASVLLRQQVGKVQTENPLLLFGDDAGKKIGVLAGEGLWRWRLEDYRENGNHNATNELLSKTIQFLSTKDDKRKFRVYPARAAFDENERVILNAELYNDAFELINEPDVNITLKNQQNKSFSYMFSRSYNAYTLDAGVLPAGNYSFSSVTQLGKNRHTAGGQFVVSQQLAEYRQTVANHQLLFAIADDHGGKMIYHDQLAQLRKLIETDETIKTVSYEESVFDELLSWKLLFFVVLALLSTEWFLRKRNGEL